MTFCVTQLKLYTLDKLSSTIFCCLCVSEGSVSLAQISTFFNILKKVEICIYIYTGIKALLSNTESRTVHLVQFIFQSLGSQLDLI